MSYLRGFLTVLVHMPEGINSSRELFKRFFDGSCSYMPEEINSSRELFNKLSYLEFAKHPVSQG